MGYGGVPPMGYGAPAYGMPGAFPMQPGMQPGYPPQVGYGVPPAAYGGGAFPMGGAPFGGARPSMSGPTGMAGADPFASLQRPQGAQANFFVPGRK